MSERELSGDDKKAIWNFVDVIAGMINDLDLIRHPGDGPIRQPFSIELHSLFIRYAKKYGIDPELIRASVNRYVKDESQKI